MGKIRDFFRGYKEPSRRPRFVIWTGVVLMALIGFVVVALYATSTRWFCAQVCHKVQDDAIMEYEASSHSEISCLACHMPVNADPVTFLIHKAEAGILGGLHTVTDTFIIPLNGASALAMEDRLMGEKQCVQCHSKNRKVTASPGIIIDHEVHEKNGVWCTLCHNRVAHPEEGIKFVTKDPKTGKMNPGHPDFMKMDYCFRCHVLEGNPKPEGKWQAPGACIACHTPDFDLKPASHKVKGFYPKGHAELAAEDHEKVVEEEAEAKVLEEEGIPKQLATPVSYCDTCHVREKFCTACHGMDMPHPEEFKTKTHPEAVKKQFDKCVMCHGEPATTNFCNKCHHGEKVGWEFDPKTKWINQHATAVSKNGFDKCLGACHEEKFCYACHNSRKPFPSSHRKSGWLHRPNRDPNVKDIKGQPNKATHALNAASQIKECELCHGAGGAGSKFCKGCHRLEMPHPSTFKDFHAKTGRTSPGVCKNCHQFKEICSNCHHSGSSVKASWIRIHGADVYKSGDAGCFEKCHKSEFCNKCHNRLKPVPASHRKNIWTRDMSSKKALHAQAYESQGASCGYCHGKEPPAQNKFCLKCHKLEIPHPGDFKDTHKADFASKKLNRAWCGNCHGVAFCNGCHHNYTGKQAWRFQHDDVVKKSGPDSCLAKCHKETYCSHCHVRLIH